MSYTLSPFTTLTAVGLSLLIGLSLLALAGSPMMGLLVVLPFIATLAFVRHQYVLAMRECIASSRDQQYLRRQEL